MTDFEAALRGVRCPQWFLLLVAVFSFLRTVAMNLLQRAGYR